MKPHTRWIAIIIGLLGFSVVTQLTLVIMSARDLSFAVESDYESKAANWDDHQRQESRNRQLGWTTTLTTAPSSAPGELTISLDLYDRWGKPILDARVAYEACHIARANRILRGELSHIANERYRTTLPIARSGQWEWRLTIDRGEERFTRTIRLSILAPPKSSRP